MSFDESDFALVKMLIREATTTIPRPDTLIVPADCLLRILRGCLSQAAEIERLKRGDLTPEEFHSLCHRLDERKDRPCTWREHEEACLRFRNQLFGVILPCELIGR